MRNFNVYTCMCTLNLVFAHSSCAYGNDFLCMLHITLYVNFLMHVYICPHRFGFCEVVISDQGREFVNQVETEFLGLTGTQHRITALLKVVNNTQSHWDYNPAAILFT